MPKSYLTYRCPRCGGDNVGYDANSVWSDLAQTWVLGSSFDDGWCNHCGEVEPEELQLTRSEVASLRASRAAEPLAQLIAVAAAANDALSEGISRLQLNNCEGEENAAIRLLQRRRTALRKAVSAARTVNIWSLQS